MFDDWKVLEVVFKFGHIHIGTEDFAVAESEIERDFVFVNSANSRCLKVIVQRRSWNNDFFSPFIISTHNKNTMNFGLYPFFKLTQW